MSKKKKSKETVKSEAMNEATEQLLRAIMDTANKQSANDVDMDYWVKFCDELLLSAIKNLIIGYFRLMRRMADEVEKMQVKP